MATFTSKPVTVAQSAQAISDKFADLTRLQSVLDNMPEEQRAKVGDVRLESDAIVINTPQVGAITLKVTERSAGRVQFTAMGSPVPMNLDVNLQPLSAESTEVTTEMQVEIPAMLKPLVGGAMQKAVDQFGNLIGKLV